jgi:hypothetical protein
VMYTGSRVGRGVGVNPGGKPLAASALVASGVGGRVAAGVGRRPGPGHGVGVTITVAAITCGVGSKSGAAKESVPVR